jgi:hypothetical protein
MGNSMAASPTLTLPRCENPAQSLAQSPARLAGSALPYDRLTAEERDQMYALLDTYFAGVGRARFEADLAEKDTVILLRDADSNIIRGFSTLMRMTVHVDGREIAAFFSGDTIIHRDYWGETILSRMWAQTVFAEVDRLTVERPEALVYWFLICSGYKTWRFLPVFFREFYPNAASATPAHIQRILDALGQAKFGEEYLPGEGGEGIVRFRAATPLRPGVAEITDQRLHDPHVAFFARANPGHHRGDELACLAELSRSNLTRAAARMMSRPVLE